MKHKPMLHYTNYNIMKHKPMPHYTKHKPMSLMYIKFFINYIILLMDVVSNKSYDWFIFFRS